MTIESMDHIQRSDLMKPRTRNMRKKAIANPLMTEKTMLDVEPPHSGHVSSWRGISLWQDLHRVVARALMFDVARFLNFDVAPLSWGFSLFSDMELFSLDFGDKYIAS